jgi:hypothetical protein
MFFPLLHRLQAVMVGPDRRIKASFEKNKIEPGNPNRVYVVDAAKSTG